MLPEPSVYPQSLQTRLSIQSLKKCLEKEDYYEDMRDMLSFLSTVSPVALGRSPDSTYFWIRNAIVLQV